MYYLLHLKCLGIKYQNKLFKQVVQEQEEFKKWGIKLIKTYKFINMSFIKSKFSLINTVDLSSHNLPIFDNLVLIPRKVKKVYKKIDPKLLAVPRRFRLKKKKIRPFYRGCYLRAQDRNVTMMTFNIIFLTEYRISWLLPITTISYFNLWLSMYINYPLLELNYIEFKDLRRRTRKQRKHNRNLKSDMLGNFFLT